MTKNKLLKAVKGLTLAVGMAADQRVAPAHKIPQRRLVVVRGEGRWCQQAGQREQRRRQGASLNGRFHGRTGIITLPPQGPPAIRIDDP